MTSSPPDIPFAEIIARSKKAAGFLRILNHARGCAGTCAHPACIETYPLLTHVAVCVLPACAVQGCQTTKTLLAHVAECSRTAGSGAARQACLVCTMAAEPWVASPRPPVALLDAYEDTEGDDVGMIVAEDWAGDDDMSTELPIKTHIPSFHSSYRSANDSIKSVDSTAGCDDVGNEHDGGGRSSSALAKRTREVRSPQASRRPSFDPAAPAASPGTDPNVVSEHGATAVPPEGDEGGLPRPPPPPTSPLTPGGGRAAEKLQCVGDTDGRRAVVGNLFSSPPPV